MLQQVRKYRKQQFGTELLLFCCGFGIIIFRLIFNRKICVCAHLAQTCHVVEKCAEMSINMNQAYEKLTGCLECIRKKTDFVPKVGIVLGSGLGEYAEEIQVVKEIPTEK